MAESIELKGAMGLLKKSQNLLAPIFEAITNSYEAISEKQFASDELPLIIINFHFTGLFEQIRNFSYIEIIDNGAGFNDQSFHRYKTLLDKSKGYKNRGSGRIQFLHRFERIEVSSAFRSDGQYFKRSFLSNSSSLVSGENTLQIQDDKTGSKIVFRDFKAGTANKESLDDITIEDVQSAIKNKFLLKLYLDKAKAPQIEINFYKNNLFEKKLTIRAEDIPAPTNEGHFDVDYFKISGALTDIRWIPTGKKERLFWVHWKLPEVELSENGIFLCSKNVAIQTVPFLKIKKYEVINGFRHLTAVYGDYLDRAESVNDAVDKFTIPQKKDVEREATESLYFDAEGEYIFIDEIEDRVKKILPEIYTEIKELKKEQDHRVEYYAELHGISREIAHSANIDLSDSDEKIVEKIFKKQAEILAKDNYKISQLYESLIDLSPNDDEYQQLLKAKGSELLELIPLQNKNELARYIIRREMVTKILGLILKNSLTEQTKPREKGERTDKEGYIHDLVFKRKLKHDDGLNDLWILNEEYMHFDGCSDVPLNQIRLPNGNLLFPATLSEDDLLSKFRLDKRKLRRPDIFLFPEEGKCILIEFKAHDVDLSDHLNQLTKYANLIANFSTSKMDSFYCYLIGESVDRIDLPGEFIKTVYGDYVKANQRILSIEPDKEETEIAKMYQEIVHLSNIEKRASVRNKSFADKLGIRLEQVPLDDGIDK